MNLLPEPPPVVSRAGIRRSIIALILLAGIRLYLSAAPLWYEPYKAELPDGRVINLFISGDEFFNWLHDTLGYPVKSAADGYYYYMIQNDSVFTYSQYRAGEINPADFAMLKTIVIPSTIEKKRVAFFKQMAEEDEKRKISADSKYSGVYNNLVIYIKFNDQPDFATSRTAYNNRLNSLSGSSVRHYYREISYNKIDMVSYHMPGDPTENLSFTDINPRNYYRPYDASTNPIGYSSDSQKTSREHNLLARAIKFVNDNYTKPDGVNFDTNNDGYFDNVAFIVKGTSDAWSDLLWPHRWSLYSLTANLWGKRVYGYTFQMENVSVKTFTHEMFHALGAPDLYHYTSDGISPAGPWDLMQSGGGHPLAWMKNRYGGWIESMPEITKSGTYTLLPLTSSQRNCYKIASPYSTNEFIVLEFRKRTGIYESTLPSDGIIISRIDTRYRGNAQGPPDEVYVYRPGGTTTTNGSVNQATFSNVHGRIAFNESTNPAPFLQNGSEAGIFIRDIRYYTDSMTFTVDRDMPIDLSINKLGDSELRLSWGSTGGSPFMIAVSSTNEIINPGGSPAHSPGDPIGTNGTIVYKGSLKSFAHTSLESDKLYYYTIWSVIDEAAGEYSLPLTGSERTGIRTIDKLPYTEDFSQVLAGLLPGGWKAQGGVSQWDISSSINHSEPNAVLFRNLGTSGEWLYTPGVNFYINKNYLITFRYRDTGQGQAESLTLYCGTDRHNNGLLQNYLFSDSKIKYGDFIISRSVFKPKKNGTYYLGLKTSYGGQGVIIDDFRIEVVPEETTNLTDPVRFYPNPSHGRITVPAVESTTVNIYMPDGTPMMTKIIEGTSDIDLSELKTGIYYIRFTTVSGTSAGSKLVIVSAR